MSATLHSLMNRLGYEFRDPSLLDLALTHRSVSKRNNNERLEFLGDAQLSQIVSCWLYERFPLTREGQLTRMRASLVRGQTLAIVAAELGLGDYLHLGSGELKSGGFRRESILADALEAVIGAILLDGGFETCGEVVLKWFAPRLESISPDAITKDAKTRLQEWLQSRQFDLPVYQLDSTIGQPPNQTFFVSCVLAAQEQSFKSKGSSRRKAEQACAELALKWLTQA